MRTKSQLELDVANLIIDTLNLEDISAEEIDVSAPLFRDGLGLDSIDALELALAMQQKYGIVIKSDDDNNVQVFSSLSALSEHVRNNRHNA